MKKRFCVILAVLFCLNTLVVPAFAVSADTKDKAMGKASNGFVSDVRNVSISENDDGLKVTPIDNNPSVKKGGNIKIGYQVTNSSDKEQSVKWSIVSSPFELSDIKVDGRSLSIIGDEGVITLKSGAKIKIEFTFQVPLNFEDKDISIRIDFYPSVDDTVGPTYKPEKDVNPYPEGSWPWYEREMKKQGIYFA